MTSQDLVPTLSSRIRNKSQSSPVVEVVQFTSYKKKQKNTADTDEGEWKKKEEVVDMKMARYEIMRFGMKRMTGGEKEKTKDKIAIELGAKPDKNKYVNYKQLQESRKQERVKDTEERKLLEISRKTMGKKSVKKVNRNEVIRKKIFKKRNKNDGIMGKYGKPTLKVPKSKK